MNNDWKIILIYIKRIYQNGLKTIDGTMINVGKNSGGKLGVFEGGSEGGLRLGFIIGKVKPMPVSLCLG